MRAIGWVDIKGSLHKGCPPFGEPEGWKALLVEDDKHGEEILAGIDQNKRHDDTIDEELVSRLVEDYPLFKHEIVTQGAVRVNQGHVFIKHDDIVCVYIDLHSKRASVNSTSSGSIPCVHLEAVEETLHVDESKPRELLTVLKFPEYAGWDIFSAKVSRYTLSICLIKR
jgi:hypothetical protein